MAAECKTNVKSIAAEWFIHHGCLKGDYTQTEEIC